MEEGILAEGPPNTNKIMGEAPSVETVVVSLLSARQFNLAIGGPRKPKSLNMLVMNLPVKQMKLDHHPADVLALGPDVAQSIINR